MNGFAQIRVSVTINALVPVQAFSVFNSCLYRYGTEESKLWFRITITVHEDNLLYLTTKAVGKSFMKRQWLLVDTERPAVNVFEMYFHRKAAALLGLWCQRHYGLLMDS